jgi:SHS2 domain-containing protein
VYIDPDPVQPAPPPSGRSPGFFATLKGALSDLPRNEPIAEQLEAIARFNDRVRKRRAIVDSARPEIARLVMGLAAARGDGPLSPADLGAWREAANEHAARDAGFAYQGYVRQKLDAVQSYVARFIASICGLREDSPEARAVEAIIAAWARRRGIVYREDPATRAGRCVEGMAPPWIRFLHAFDVEFRERRLVFLIQGQNRLYAKMTDDDSADARRRIDALKRELYRCLDRLRRYEGPEFQSSVTCSQLKDLFAAPLGTEQVAELERHAERFAADNEPALTRLVDQLAADIDLDAATNELDVLLAGMDPQGWPPPARREVLVNYVGFPLWDVLTLAVTSRRDFGEFDEIRVDRVSPADARTLARMTDVPPLRGTAFMHFGAFFSRAFRENDYLLGRLQAVDRLIDIVCDSAGYEALAGVDVPALKRRAFELVLRAEEPHLPNVRDLVERLRTQLVQAPASTGRWEHFPHDADLGVRGRGATLTEAFEQAALALAAAVVDPSLVAETESVDVECEAPSADLLLVDWLNAVIFEMTTRNLCFRRFEVALDGLRLRGRAFGETVHAAKHELGIEPKGATYTALRVAREPDGGWLAQCVVDV